MQRHDAEHAFHPARRAQQVTGHGLVGRDADVLGVVAEHLLDGLGFAQVVEVRRGGVGVDVVHVLGADARLVDGGAHGLRHAQAVFVRGGHVVGVAGRAVAHHFCVNGGAARLGRFQRFQHQEAGAFTDDEAVAVVVERARGLGGGVVVGRGQRLQCGEAGNAHGRDGGFHAAGDHRVAAAHEDVGIGIADGMLARRTGAGGDQVGPLGPGEDGNLARRHVGDQHGDHERRDAVGAGLDEFGMEDLDGLQSAKAHAQQHAHAVGVGVVDDEAGMLDEHLAGGHRELDETVHALGLLGRHVLLWVEALDLAGDARGVLRSVEVGDGPDAGLSGHQVLPACRKVVTKGGDGRKAGHDDTLSGH
ncbi:hypothetical protein DSECCO2_652490 [anaerobic digester metagenome]